jgi:hypothetical protein
MTLKIKEKFNLYIENNLNKVLRFSETRMDTYKKWYNLDDSEDKYRVTKAIIKDLHWLSMGRKYGWLLSHLIIDEIESEGSN